ncbi:hypothetical protein [Flavobacterium filum]|uniref:hypothetical protein n=1 Tax=Flavobacterium TaxID=237 RepID=UPI0004105E24|nr:hypothetical protein [Flavobacterium filum]
MNKIISFLIPFLFFGCGKHSKTVEGEWIKGTETEQITIIENHFRGFDNAMLETGYRYQELFWAGQDENWEYADYQITKMQLAIKNGLERRPKRSKSAEYFLTYDLPKMQEVVKNRDLKNFNQAFQHLTISCNSCHALEKVPFFNIQIPEVRQSPVRK